MNLTRRALLKSSGVFAGASVINQEANLTYKTAKNTISLCLNLSTIMGQNLGFIKELQIAQQAGFSSVEIWVPTLEKYLQSGGSISEAKKIISDLGLRIENTIGFAPWIVDDQSVRGKGLEQLKKEMAWVRELGCLRTAAPPMGATQQADLNLKAAADRYAKILELGKQMEVVPQLEMWGHSKCLNRVADLLFVAAEAGHPDAKLLLDVFHIYKGESSLDSLHLVGENSIEIFHVNDYSAQLKPASIKDADRIYVGDGDAPIVKIIHSLNSGKKPLVISLELFNKELYAKDALLVAKEGYAKMKKLKNQLEAGSSY
jgi:sugar phosphate isomerase/epimerase